MLLPHVEKGTVILVGATTENPSFSMTAALSSRSRTFALLALGVEALAQLVARIQTHSAGIAELRLSDEGRVTLHRLCAGDGRRALTAATGGLALADDGVTIDGALLLQVAQGVQAQHDPDGEAHYDVASAFIKSMRASDVQAALFYLARQLEAVKTRALWRGVC